MRSRRASGIGRTASALIGAALIMAATCVSSPQPAEAAQARVAAGVERSLRTLPPGRPMTVIVTMRDQAELPPAGSLAHDDRVRRTVVLLRREAARTQESIRLALARLTRSGAVRRVDRLWVINGLAVKADEKTIRYLASRPDVATITGNENFLVPASPAVSSAPTEPNIELTGAPALWAQNVTGSGAVVATLDTGVDASHPDLAARWRGGANSWFDPYGQHLTTPTDVSGHGTQVLGLIVGGDAHGTSIGMAPGAKWIAAKIFRDNGSSTVSGIHQAFQWVLDPDGTAATADAPNVLNGSWSLGSPGCDLTFQPDLQALIAAGILPVFAAANFGPSPETSASPANNPEAFAVGAVDDTDTIASDSSRGPSACGESSISYPELTAPGVDTLTSDLLGSWVSSTGTSMSAPHVAGALALLTGIRPDLTPTQQSLALRSSAIDLGPIGPDDAFGSGRLDAAAAYGSLPPPPPPPPPPTVDTPPTATTSPSSAGGVKGKKKKRKKKKKKKHRGAAKLGRTGR